MMQDLRYAVRSLWNRPAFTVVACLTLAIGIGANTAIFSLVHGVLLNPLPYPDAERIVVLHEQPAPAESELYEVSYPNFLDWRRDSRSFTQLAAFTLATATLRGGDMPAERALVGYASDELFGMLGVSPVVGRSFTPEEHVGGGEAVAILTHRVWQDRYGADRAVVGRSISVSGTPHTIIGVAPQTFEFPTDDLQLWMPLERLADQMQNRAAHMLDVLGRLRDGVPREVAEAELQTVTARIEDAYPGEDPSHSVVVVPLLDEMVSDTRGMLIVLFGAVVFVLLIACANVADLLLVRASTRRREMAVRAALGADRWRVIRQLLVESLVLAIAAGVIGIVIAFWGVEVLLPYLPESIPRVAEVGVNGPVLAFTLALTLVTGIGFGLVPAVTSARPDLHGSLTQREASSAGGKPALKSALAIAQVAISLVLLVGAGLTIKSLWRLQQVDPGFEPEHLLSLTVSLAGSELREVEQVTAFYDELRDRIEAIPGVQSASAVNTLPVSGGDSRGQLTIDGRPFPPGRAPAVSFRRIQPNYFRTMQVPLLEGRDFTVRDGVDEPFVVIINETMARRYWPDGSPIGSRIKVGPSEHEPWLTVVGVAADLKNEGLAAGPDLATYEPHRQRPWTTMNVLVRTAGDPLALVPVIRDEIRRAGTDLPVYNITTLRQRISASLATERFTVMLLMIFAGIALLLAIIGVYGVISFSVSQRTREFGIRMALGAARRDVARLVLRQGVILAFVGTLIGVAAALGFSRLLVGLLFGVEPTDATTFVSVAMILLLCASLAAYLPARRATRVPPMEALRYE